MSAEDQINMLKQTPPLSKTEKRSRITLAIVLALSSLMSVLFLVYGILQRTEASKQKELAESLKVELMQSRDVAIILQREAELSRMETEKQKAMAEEALKNCMKSK